MPGNGNGVNQNRDGLLHGVFTGNQEKEGRKRRFERVWKFQK